MGKKDIDLKPSDLVDVFKEAGKNGGGCVGSYDEPPSDDWGKSFDDMDSEDWEEYFSKNEIDDPEDYYDGDDLE